MFEYESPDGFESIGKVYLVEYDNGESYEDNYNNIEHVFKTRDDAEKYLDSEYERRPTKRWTANGFVDDVEWSYPKFVCSMNNMDCEDCPKCKDYEDGWDDCDEYYERMNSQYENPYWSILEYDLLCEKAD